MTTALLPYTPAIAAGLELAAAYALGIGVTRSKATIEHEEATYGDGGNTRIHSQTVGALVGRLGLAFLAASAALQFLAQYYAGPRPPIGVAGAVALGVAVAFRSGAFAMSRWWSAKLAATVHLVDVDPRR